MKFILVVGGPCSGIGKGIVTSSIGALLRACQLRVSAVKIDPYYNYDAGLFSPYEHGEVFVLDDGSEVDLDLGNYERFLDTNLTAANNITTGKVNREVYERERRGDFLGQTCQAVPHVTNLIQEWIVDAANKQQADVCMIELGGTVGDLEVGLFLEALLLLKIKVGEENFFCCGVNAVCSQNGELKSKPAQYSARTLRHSGPYPDIAICRSEFPCTDSIRRKLAIANAIRVENVYNLIKLSSTYAVPIELEKQGILNVISNHLKLDLAKYDLDKWAAITDAALNSSNEVTIALVGKYTSQRDCYLSVIKAFEHACYKLRLKPKLIFVDSELLESSDPDAWTSLRKADCLIVPGGFGLRGTEGKIEAIRYARENQIPFLGVCLGLQLAAIEFARNKLGIKNASSAEFESENSEDVVIEMLDYKDPENKLGGTMRLGLKKTYFLDKQSILRNLYSADVIEERHRHRYEINPNYIPKFETCGLKFVGRSEDGTRMQVLELDQHEHPYFVGVQFHPEYKTRPFRPSPAYFGLVLAASRAHK